MTQQADPRHDPSRLSADETRLVETLRSQLDPGELPPARRAAFRARLEERLERGSGRSWQPLVVFASAVVAAWALWLALPGNLLESGAPDVDPVATSEAGLVAYAYYETDYLADDEAEASSFLSDEYLAIATAFDLP